MTEYDLTALCVPLPEDVQKCKLAGDIEGAKRLIERRLEDKSLGGRLKDRLALEKLALERLPGEYPLSRAQALAQLGADGRGFFLMVEEASLDKSSHQQNAEACIRAMDRFDDLIAYVTEYVVCHPDTVLVITADHETGGITRQADGSFRYTRGSHSGVDVPIYAIGAGTEIFRGQTVQNTAIAKFLAGIYGSTDFGE